MNIENIYNKELDSLLDRIEENNSLYSQKREYQAKTIKSGEVLEVVLYEVWNSKSQNKQKAKQITQSQQENLNHRNSQMQCVRKMNANFGYCDSWITLTYSKSNLPNSEDEADKNLRNYILRLKRNFKDIEIKYIYSTEIGTGRVHHHLVVNVADRDKLEDLWSTASEMARKRKNPKYKIKQLGRTLARRLQPDDFGLTGMAKYITKESAKNKKKFRCSKNLILPEVKKTKTIKGKKITNRFVKKIAEDKVQAKATFLEMFPNYQFNEVSVKQTPYTKGYYVYATLKQVDVMAN